MLTCLSCARAWPGGEPRWRCACGGRLKLAGAGMFAIGDVAGRPPSLWRYREAFGLHEGTQAVTLGEGFTPLVPAELAGRRVRLKLDFLGPTGSYKDRGSAVMISKLKEWGVTEILEDSSGNAGASIAAYSAAAGIRAEIYVPASTSAGKAAQIRSYGATLVPIEGSRDMTARAAWEAAERKFYASHNWSPYFAAGLQTVAYEIGEQLGWRAPDWVVAPAGNGGLAAGVHQGFRDLREAGIVSGVPRLVAVQARECAPIWQAWRADAAAVAGVTAAPTAAEGIAIGQPVRGGEVLEALRESGGLAHAVTEDAIWEALAAAGRLGLYIEPTSATAVAAVCELSAAGVIPAGEMVVVILTGSGLKATDKIVPHLMR